MIRVAINGFGRIGRNFLRCWLTRDDSQIEVVAINDTSDPGTNSHLLKYDSMLGRLEADVQAGEDSLIVNGKTIKCCSARNPTLSSSQLACFGVLKGLDGTLKRVPRKC